MVEAFLVCALAASIVGGVVVPASRILMSVYSDERKRLEAGGTPVYPQSTIHPEIFEEMQPPKSSRQEVQ